jgi:hypothetical protein
VDVAVGWLWAGLLVGVSSTTKTKDVAVAVGVASSTVVVEAQTSSNERSGGEYA